MTFRNETLRKFFPRSYTAQQMQDQIIKLLEQWQKQKQNSSSGQDPDAGYLDDDDDLDIYELPEEPEVKKEPVSEDDPDYWLDEEDDE